MRRAGVPLMRWGRPLRHSGARTRRDRARGAHSSDEVWALVDRMLQGDHDAARVIHDVIEEGVDGDTKFVKIVKKGTRKLMAKPEQYRDTVVEDQFAAVTPQRSIVLFGVRDVWEKGTPSRRAYITRYLMNDRAVFDRDQTAKIVNITDKRITMYPMGYLRGRTTRLLDLQQFAQANWDAARVQKIHDDWVTRRQRYDVPSTAGDARRARRAQPRRSFR